MQCTDTILIFDYVRDKLCHEYYLCDVLVYVCRVGEKVKPLTKGKVSAFAGPVEKVFSPTHVCLSFTNRYDITDEVISDKVR